MPAVVQTFSRTSHKRIFVRLREFWRDCCNCRCLKMLCRKLDTTTQFPNKYRYGKYLNFILHYLVRFFFGMAPLMRNKVASFREPNIKMRIFISIFSVERIKEIFTPCHNHCTSWQILLDEPSINNCFNVSFSNFTDINK